MQASQEPMDSLVCVETMDSLVFHPSMEQRVQRGTHSLVSQDSQDSRVLLESSDLRDSLDSEGTSRDSRGSRPRLGRQDPLDLRNLRAIRVSPAHSRLRALPVVEDVQVLRAPLGLQGGGDLVDTQESQATLGLRGSADTLGIPVLRDQGVYWDHEAPLQGTRALPDSPETQDLQVHSQRVLLGSRVLLEILATPDSRVLLG